MAKELISNRSFQRIELSDLQRLADFAWDDFKSFSQRHQRPELMKNLICIALCQGAALHYVDGKNGIKDFDVYGFFKKGTYPDFPPRRRTTVDFGQSIFGRHPADSHFNGRRVDILGRSIVQEKAIRDLDSVLHYVASKKTTTAWHLAQKAIVVVWPHVHIGKIIWPSIRSGG